MAPTRHLARVEMVVTGVTEATAGIVAMVATVAVGTTVREVWPRVVIGTNDYTVSPNVLQASFNGGQVAGPAKIHIRFDPPTNYVAGSAQITSVMVDEVAHHYPVNSLGSGAEFGNSYA